MTSPLHLPSPGTAVPGEGAQAGSVQPYWSDGTVTLHPGDCLDVLKAMPDPARPVRSRLVSTLKQAPDGLACQFRTGAVQARTGLSPRPGAASAPVATPVATVASRTGPLAPVGDRSGPSAREAFERNAVAELDWCHRTAGAA